MVEERYNEGRQIAQYERRLQERIINPEHIPESRTYRKSNRICEEEEAVFVEKYVDKPVEILVERKIPVERIVEVPYDVIVEKPIERITEVEIDVEKIVHREYEKIVEVPIERIVEIPVENVIERPV